MCHQSHRASTANLSGHAAFLEGSVATLRESRSPNRHTTGKNEAPHRQKMRLKLSRKARVHMLDLNFPAATGPMRPTTDAARTPARQPSGCMRRWASSQRQRPTSPVATSAPKTPRTSVSTTFPPSEVSGALNKYRNGQLAGGKVKTG